MANSLDYYLRPIANGDIIKPGTRFYFNWTDEMIIELKNRLFGTGESPILFLTHIEADDSYRGVEFTYFVNAQQTWADLSLLWFTSDWESEESTVIIDLLHSSPNAAWTIPFTTSWEYGVVEFDIETEGVDIYDAFRANIFVDPATLYNANDAEVESFGSIIKNGIAYSLIYKNNVQYASIYLGGNRWWTYGTGSDREIYKRRVMVGDIFVGNETVLYSDFDYAKDNTYFQTRDLTNSREDNLITISPSGNNIQEVVDYTSDTEWYYAIQGENGIDSLTAEFYVAFDGYLFSTEKSAKFVDEGTHTVTAVASDNPSYRRLYIEDPNIRPLQARDYCIPSTVFYGVVPEDFYKENIEDTVFGEIVTACKMSISPYELSYSKTEDYVGYGTYGCDIYYYQTGENSEFWNMPSTSIDSLLDFGGMFFPSTGYVTYIDSSKKYYDYLLVDQTTLGLPPIKKLDLNIEPSNYEVWCSISESELVNHEWLLEYEDGQTEFGRWSKSSEPGPYTMGSLYNWRGHNGTTLMLEETSPGVTVLVAADLADPNGEETYHYTFSYFPYEYEEESPL